MLLIKLIAVGCSALDCQFRSGGMAGSLRSSSMILESRAEKGDRTIRYSHNKAQLQQDEVLINDSNSNPITRNYTYKAPHFFRLGSSSIADFIFTSFIFTSLISTSLVFVGAPGLALPPPEDLPEEVLRTEIVTEARSPIDGEWLTAAEYAELEAELQRNPELYNSISSEIREIIFLLQVRRAVRSIAPFLLP